MTTGAFAAARAFDPARLTMARRLLGLSKRELAEWIGRPAALLSRFELGQSRPDVTVLSRCAQVMELPVGFFAAGRPQLRLDTTNAHFRSLRATTATQRLQALAQVELLWEVLSRLEDLIELPVADLAPAATGSDPARAARAVRRGWDVPSGPVPHLVRTLEARGVAVARLVIPDNKNIDAFSSAKGGRPIIALTDRGNPLRQRFSVAHELGHLLLHPEPAPGNPRHEAEANAFAAELLMPATEIGDLLPVEPEPASLRDLGHRYGVSMAALAVRGRTLGFYSDTTYREVMVELSRLGLRTDEPVSEVFPGEEPTLLRTATEMAADQGVGLAELAARIEVTPAIIRRLLGIPDPRPHLRLVTSP
ncbi:helix-turn-helix domain-containing protein [Actinoalloteichus caeruleus]|uniref:Zn-dependent peptidase ImmA, M78 family n=1 Tax=Actinoalloteichus caeruleus DSM 43889 TaxID=1120930 RepID=A0ABT1JQE8_ACTCY|nr:XRE family transcriptional regulator [Actinoalloteichus caeruleus]MCP2334366.1 Zn-dependent peptidase ImmA, M78 family [Actinoalloteichus caeruleus DSM 43889]